MKVGGGGGVTHDDIIEDSGIGLYTIHKDWASPLQHYLETCTFPETLNKDQRRRIAIKALPYSLVGRNSITCVGMGSFTHVFFPQRHTKS